jgi:hypothetical protein
MPTEEEIVTIRSSLLRTLFTECPNLCKDVDYFLSAIDESALTSKNETKSDEKPQLLLNPNAFPKVNEAKRVCEFSFSLSLYPPLTWALNSFIRLTHSAQQIRV